MSKPKTKSRWRLQARRIIEDTINSAPPGTSPHAIRLLVRAAYPFGARAHEPYRAWLKEQRLALGTPKQPKSVMTAGKPCLRVGKRPGGTLPWLTVRCGWCEARTPGGCLVCCRLYLAINEVVSDPEFQSLRQALRNDEGVRPILGDWLEERLGDRCGL